MKKGLLTLLLNLTLCFVFAQQGNHIWYFGQNAGLDFRYGEPTPLLDGALNINEGCATISDDDGNLLFYTDGLSVWNSNHIVMPNGTGLLGDPSATQSSVVVPHPGNADQYYIFTVPASEVDLNIGLNYSIVDMTLEGGLGDITTKNVLLCNPITERVTAVINQDGTGIWVITHLWNSDAFYAYLIDNAGLNTTPVISSVGSTHTDVTTNAAGYFKASIDGNKLAIARTIRTISTFPGQFPSTIEMFDFDNSTGIVSNPIITPSTYFRVYGLEFSPDGSKLYFANNQPTSSTNPMEIYQMDLSAGSATDIINSATIIGTHPKPSISTFAGALQLARNGKIYVSVAGSEYLGVIQNPDVLGTGANYISNGVYLGGQIANYGLPNFIYGFESLGDPLKTTFIHLSATAQHNYNVLKWTVSSDDPLQYFEIQKSPDAKTFETIAHTDAQTGTHTYTWEDYTPAPDWIYYRIVAINPQGNALASRMVALQSASMDDVLQIYPNPLSSDQPLQIQLPDIKSSAVSLTLWNAQGQKVYDLTNVHTANTIQLPALPKGIYYLQVKADGLKQNLSKKLVVW
jgi:hypothetical protein